MVMPSWAQWARHWAGVSQMLSNKVTRRGRIGENLSLAMEWIVIRQRSDLASAFQAQVGLRDTHFRLCVDFINRIPF